MAATIINITGADNAANIAGVGSMAARVLAIGSSWTSIRLGWRWSVEDTGGNITFTGANDRPLMGLMASPSPLVANGPLTNVTSNFLGEKQSGTLVRVVGPPVHYSGFTFFAIKRAGAVDTSHPGGPSMLISTGTMRTAHILTITKGSPNWVVDRIFLSGTTGLVDLTIENLLTVMQEPTTATALARLNALSGVAGYSSSPINVAATTVNEAVDGFLNAIVFGWGKLTGLRFSEMAFVQIS